MAAFRASHAAPGTQYRDEMLAFQDTMTNFADELATLATVEEPADL